MSKPKGPDPLDSDKRELEQMHEEVEKPCKIEEQKTCVRCGELIPACARVCSRCQHDSRFVVRWLKRVIALAPIIASIVALGGFYLTSRQFDLVQRNLDLVQRGLELQSISIERADSSLRLVSNQIQLQRDELQRQERNDSAQALRYVESNRPIIGVGPVACQFRGKTPSLLVNYGNIGNSSASDVSLRLIAQPLDRSKSRVVDSISVATLVPKKAGEVWIVPIVLPKDGLVAIKVSAVWSWSMIGTRDSIFAYYAVNLVDSTNCKCMKENAKSAREVIGE
jgi:RNA polymerase subunit RPABC4/transcription elongation factor Spt4